MRNHNRYGHTRPLDRPGALATYRTAMVPTGGVSALPFLDTASGQASELQRFDYDELTTRRQLLDRKLSELRIADERRLLQRKELSDVHRAAMERVTERRRQNDDYAHERNQKFLARFDDAIKRLDGEPLKRGPLANHSQSSKADLRRAINGFYENVASLQPEYQAQMERWRMDEIRELERQKTVAEQRRMVSKLAFEKERAVTAAVARQKQELAIAEVKEQGEALERRIFRQEEEKENRLIQEAIAEAARNTLSELHRKELVGAFPQAARDGDLASMPLPGGFAGAAGAGRGVASAAATEQQAEALQQFVQRNFGEILKKQLREQNQEHLQPVEQQQQQRPPRPGTDEVVAALAEAAKATSALADEAQRQLGAGSVGRGGGGSPPKRQQQHRAPGASDRFLSNDSHRPSPPPRLGQASSSGPPARADGGGGGGGGGGSAGKDDEPGGEAAAVQAAQAQLSEGLRQVHELSQMLDDTEQMLESAAAAEEDAADSPSRGNSSSSNNNNNHHHNNNNNHHQSSNRVSVPLGLGPWEATVAQAGAMAAQALLQQQAQAHHSARASYPSASPGASARGGGGQRVEKGSILAELEALEQQQARLRAQIHATQEMPGGWAGSGSASAFASGSGQGAPLQSPSASLRGPPLSTHELVSVRDVAGHDGHGRLTDTALDLLGRVGSLQRQRAVPPINPRTSPPRRSIGERLMAPAGLGGDRRSSEATTSAWERPTSTTDYDDYDTDSYTDGTALGGGNTSTTGMSGSDLSLELELDADHLASKLAKLSQQLVSLHAGGGAGGSVGTSGGGHDDESSIHYDDSVEGGEGGGARSIGSLRDIEQALHGLRQSAGLAAAGNPQPRPTNELQQSARQPPQKQQQQQQPPPPPRHPTYGYENGYEQTHTPALSPRQPQPHQYLQQSHPQPFSDRRGPVGPPPLRSGSELPPRPPTAHRSTDQEQLAAARGQGWGAAGGGNALGSSGGGGSGGSGGGDDDDDDDDDPGGGAAGASVTHHVVGVSLDDDGGGASGPVEAPPGVPAQGSQSLREDAPHAASAPHSGSGGVDGGEHSPAAGVGIGGGVGSGNDDDDFDDSFADEADRMVSDVADGMQRGSGGQGGEGGEGGDVDVDTQSLDDEGGYGTDSF